MSEQDYRQYLDERFSHLTTAMNGNFKFIQEDIGEIKDHLKKLNGKVAEHERKINTEIPHTRDNCPQALKIEEHDRWIGGKRAIDAEEARKVPFLALHWQKMAVAIALLLGILTAWKYFKDFKIQIISEVKAVQPSASFRGGGFYDSTSGKFYYFDPTMINIVDSIYKSKMKDRDTKK